LQSDKKDGQTDREIDREIKRRGGGERERKRERNKLLHKILRYSKLKQLYVTFFHGQSNNLELAASK